MHNEDSGLLSNLLNDLVSFMLVLSLSGASWFYFARSRQLSFIGGIYEYLEDFLNLLTYNFWEL